jgi:hypothetical protein
MFRVKESTVAPGKVSGKTNGDIYTIANKVVPIKPFPVVLNAGVRDTNAELWSMGGNAPDWQARALGAVALVLKEPAKSTIIVASEAARQPQHPLDSSKLNIPTTFTYCARGAPIPKYKLNVDVGVAQIAGNVMTGVDLKGRRQVGAQVSYGS